MTNTHVPDATQAAAVIWTQRAADLTQAIDASERSRLERSALWQEIEGVAGKETASDIAAETGLSLGTYRQERAVGLAYPSPADWLWTLPWSHYRATSARRLDPDVRSRLMDAAEALNQSEAELRAAVRDALACADAGECDGPGGPVDPRDYPEARDYAVARWREIGRSEARAVDAVDGTLAYLAEWDRSQDAGDLLVEAMFGALAPDVAFVDAGAEA